MHACTRTLNALISFSQVASIAGRDYALVASRITSQLEIFDVTDPSAVRYVTDVVRPAGTFAQAHDVAVRGSTLFVAWEDVGGFTIEDASLLGNSTVTRLGYQPFVGTPSINGGTSSALPTADGQHVVQLEYSSNGAVRVFDVQNPAAIAATGAWALGQGTYMHHGAVVGDYAFIGHLESGLRILNIADRFAPAEVAFYDPDNTAPLGRFDGVWGVVVETIAGAAGTAYRAYLSDEAQGLLIVDFDPTLTTTTPPPPTTTTTTAPPETITILKADYNARKDRLTVWATSSFNTQLEVVGFGLLSWNNGRARWEATFSGVAPNPGTITVRSTVSGATATAPTS